MGGGHGSAATHDALKVALSATICSGKVSGYAVGSKFHSFDISWNSALSVNTVAEICSGTLATFAAFKHGHWHEPGEP